VNKKWLYKHSTLEVNFVRHFLTIIKNTEVYFVYIHTNRSRVEWVTRAPWPYSCQFWQILSLFSDFLSEKKLMKYSPHLAREIVLLLYSSKFFPWTNNRLKGPDNLSSFPGKKLIIQNVSHLSFNCKKRDLEW